MPAAAARHHGGKAAGLLRLRALRLPVPEFVVLPAALFAPGLAGCPTTPAGLAGRRARLAAFELPAEALAALRPVLAGWGFPGQPVAVRSSVADEDGAAAAFPGLMDTVLSVSTWPELRAAVARVAASAYSERALAATRAGWACRWRRGPPWWCSARWPRGRRACCSAPSPSTRKRWPSTPWPGWGRGW